MSIEKPFTRRKPSQSEADRKREVFREEGFVDTRNADWKQQLKALSEKMAG